MLKHLFFFAFYAGSRFSIDKDKLQNEVGSPSLTVNCDYKNSGLCQDPILHDLAVTSDTFRGYWQTGSDPNTGINLLDYPEKVARKNLAKTESAKLKTYLNLTSVRGILNICDQ